MLNSRHRCPHGSRRRHVRDHGRPCSFNAHGADVVAMVLARQLLLLLLLLLMLVSVRSAITTGVKIGERRASSAPTVTARTRTPRVRKPMDTYARGAFLSRSFVVTYTTTTNCCGRSFTVWRSFGALNSYPH